MSAPQNNALQGVLLAAAGTIAFSLTDLSVKFLSSGYALHQLMLIRGLFVLLFVLGYALVTPNAFANLLPKNFTVQTLRTVIILVSNICFFTGLTLMPFADAAAIAYVSPLILTVLSIAFLGEKVGPRRWAAVAVGFIGVIVMLRPGAGVIQPAAILVLISSFLYALGYVLTRRMRASESAISLTVWSQIGFILLSLIIGFFVGDGRYEHSTETWGFLLRAWTWPSLQDWGLMALSGVVTTLGSIMITQAFRIAEAGLVAPMEYIGMPLAILWGALIFGTWPDATSWLGMALICGAGLYIIWRETRLRKASRP